MSYTEKVTVLELLVECIREHEARLRDLVQAAENLAYVRAHMVSARRLGLIERVGSRASGWGPPRKLYAVTPRGLEWLEAHRVIEVLLLGER